MNDDCCLKPLSQRILDTMPERFWGGMADNPENNEYWHETYRRRVMALRRARKKRKK